MPAQPISSPTYSVVSRSRPAVHAFIAAFLLLQVALAVRCYVSDGKFFGWHMFSRSVIYEIQWFGITPDGQRTPIPESVSHALLVPGAHEQLSPSAERRIMSRGRQFLLTELQRLPAFLCGRLGHAGYDRIEIVISHRDILESHATRQTFEQTCAP